MHEFTSTKSTADCIRARAAAFRSRERQDILRGTLLPPPAGGYPSSCFSRRGQVRRGLDRDTGPSERHDNHPGPRAALFHYRARIGRLHDEAPGRRHGREEAWNTSVNSEDIPLAARHRGADCPGQATRWHGRIFSPALSSGGAMVSRMAQTTPWVFARLAIIASMNPRTRPTGDHRDRERGASLHRVHTRDRRLGGAD